MTVSPESAGSGDHGPPQVYFDAVLRPHRSLGPLGFAVVMAVFAGLSLTFGAWFLLQGAWPVFGYFGLDLALLYIAFRVNYRGGRLYETVRLTEDALVVRRIEPHGQARSWTFQPYWLRVSMDDPPRHESQVTLSSHGQSLVVGAFLSPEERLDFAKALRAALERLRSGAGAMTAHIGGRTTT